MRPHRRRILATALAAACLPRRAFAHDVDVAIVGGGAAGLAAARRLLAAGFTTRVIEARTRPGGRVFTDERLGAPFEAGAAYIHWADRNPWTRIARDLGHETREDSGGPGFRGLFANGAPLDLQHRARRSLAFARLPGVLAAGAEPDRSVAEIAREAGPDLAESAAGSTRLMLGEEPDRVSAADDRALWDGPDLVVPGGYGRLVAAYGAGLPVTLGEAVRGIDWSGQGATLETTRGTLLARAAIVKVPLGVLAAEAIAFRPALPDATRDAIAGLRMGAYTKVALRIDRARLGAIDLGDAIDIGAADDPVNFDAFPFGRDLVLCYFGGDFARRLCAEGERAAVDHMSERLGAVFGATVRAAITGGALADWWTDPLSRGAYSIARPGRLAARLALRPPVGERVWLAGEASAGPAAMTVGGASLEGERAADDVIRHLRMKT